MVLPIILSKVNTDNTSIDFSFTQFTFRIYLYANVFGTHYAGAERERPLRESLKGFEKLCFLSMVLITIKVSSRGIDRTQDSTSSSVTCRMGIDNRNLNHIPNVIPSHSLLSFWGKMVNSSVASPIYVV